MKFKLNSKLTKTIATVSTIAVVASVSATYAVTDGDNISKQLVNQLVQMVKDERATSKDLQGQVTDLQEQIEANNATKSENLAILREVYGAIGMGYLSDDEILAKDTKQIGLDVSAYIQSQVESSTGNATESGKQAKEIEVINELKGVLNSNEETLQGLINEISELKSKATTANNTSMILQQEMINLQNQIAELQAQNDALSGTVESKNQAEQELNETVDYLRQQIRELGAEPVR